MRKTQRDVCPLCRQELKELQKRIADLEVQVQSQQKLLNSIIDRHAKEDECPY